MRLLDYKEPEFNIVIASTEDVLTSSYTPGAFETNAESLEPVVGG